MKSAFQRYSKGELYSAREFARAESILQERGFTVLRDTRIGDDVVRIYERAAQENKRREQVVIYTGAGQNSGIMLLPDADKGGLRGTTVWHFVNEHDGTMASRLMKSIRSRLFPG